MSYEDKITGAACLPCFSEGILPSSSFTLIVTVSSPLITGIKESERA